jgi:GT2 family glycosyltransferase
VKNKITNDVEGGRPSIDVIIPFHIIHDYLKQAIMSALESEGVRLRLLLVDDSNAIHPTWLKEISKFDNVDIIKNYKKGYLGAMESGVRNVKSQYFGFLDSDDLTDRFRFHNQIKYMQENRIEICSSSILRIDEDGRTLKGKGLLGSKFETLPPQIRLLLGAYGADSSLVINGSLAEEKWKVHTKFPAQFADYGFLLSVVDGHTYGYCPEAVYFYRNHKSQMSRQRSLLESWESVYPLWKKLLYQLSAQLPNASKIKVGSSVAAAIAFPSLLPKLSTSEVKALKKFIEVFIKDISDHDELANEDIIALKLRVQIGSRCRDISTSKYFPVLVWRLTANILTGLNPRKN